MECLKCKQQMISAQLNGGISPVHLTNKKKSIFDPEKRSSVSCLVCPECGYIELKADDPKKIIVEY